MGATQWTQSMSRSRENEGASSFALVEDSIYEGLDTILAKPNDNWAREATMNYGRSGEPVLTIQQKPLVFGCKAHQGCRKGSIGTDVVDKLGQPLKGVGDTC